MSGCVNKVLLVGHMGGDPTIRTTKGGDKIASFSLATTKTWKDRNSSERKQMTTWHDVVIFNTGLVGVVEQYTKKGSHLYVEGEISKRKYTGKDGVDRWAVEVIVPPFGGAITLLDRKEGNRPPDAESYSQYGGGSATVPPERPPGGPATSDDEVPF